jgi:hypothetical protein
MKITVKELKKVIAEVLAPASSSPIDIGYLNAFIPGDRRYTDTLRVSYNPQDDTVTVEVKDTSAAGGMDSHYGAGEPNSAFKQTTKPGAKTSEVMQLIKSCINDSRFLFKSYGKPSKNFNWPQIGKGLSTALCSAALDSVRTQG